MYFYGYFDTKINVCDFGNVKNVAKPFLLANLYKPVEEHFVECVIDQTIEHFVQNF